MNTSNDIIKPLLVNLQIVAFTEILLVKNWTHRKCIIQKEWQEDKTFIELRFEENLDLYILLDKSECYFNIQNNLEEQITKDSIANKNLPKAVKEFVLTEPVFSLGTTNIYWIIKNRMHFYKTIAKSEMNFISTFCDENSSRRVLSDGIDSKFHDFIIYSVEKGEVEIQKLKHISNISIDHEKNQAINEMGLSIK